MAFESIVNQCLTIPRYEDLWKAYLDYKGNSNPCKRTGKNQCAVRMSTALGRCGISIEGMKNVHTSNCGYSMPHVAASRDLAKHLRTFMPAPQIFKGGSIPNKLLGAKGIIFFTKCYTRKSGSRGNHIDLWDGKYIFNDHLNVNVGGKAGSKTERIFKNSKKVWFFKLA